MAKTAGIISKVAGIDLLLEGQHELKKEVVEVKDQFKILNGTVKDLKEKDIRREERESMVKERLGNKNINRREYWAAAIGAGAIASVTLLLHIAGLA